MVFDLVLLLNPSGLLLFLLYSQQLISFLLAISFPIFTVYPLSVFPWPNRPQAVPVFSFLSPGHSPGQGQAGTALSTEKPRTYLAFARDQERARGISYLIRTAKYDHRPMLSFCCSVSGHRRTTTKPGQHQSPPYLTHEDGKPSPTAGTTSRGRAHPFLCLFLALSNVKKERPLVLKDKALLAQ